MINKKVEVTVMDISDGDSQIRELNDQLDSICAKITKLVAQYHPEIAAKRKPSIQITKNYGFSPQYTINCFPHLCCEFPKPPIDKS